LNGCLSTAARARVTTFAYKDDAKVGRRVARTVTVVALERLAPPWVTAVALDRGCGCEEKVADVVARTGVVAGADYTIYSEGGWGRGWRGRESAHAGPDRAAVASRGRTAVQSKEK